MIIDPFTGRTFLQDNVLEQLMNWTMSDQIRKAMLKSGTADVGGIVNLALLIRATIQNEEGGLSESEATDVMLRMIESKPVRKAITRHVARENGVTLWQAARELKGLYVELAAAIGALETAH